MSLTLTGAGGPFVAAGGGPATVVSSVASADTSSGTSVVLTMPSSITEGNLLLCVVRNGIGTMSTPSGWTLLSSSATDGDDTVYIFYKTAGASESSTLTITNSTACLASGVIYEISSWSGTPEHTWNTGNSNDPPNHTPTGGSQTYLWIAVASGERSDNAGDYTAGPSGYSGFIQANTGNSTSDVHNRIGSAWRSLEASSEDPGTFTTGGDWYDRRAVTISIEPA